MCLCVFSVFVNARCDCLCGAARLEFACVCCVFVCILLCVVSVCGGCEVLGDVVWCVVGCVFCCVCVCFYVCVVSDVVCGVCTVCVVRVSVCACGGYMCLYVVCNVLCDVVWCVFE